MRKAIYQRARENGQYIGCCIDLPATFVIKQVERAKKGNQKEINRLAYEKGIITKEDLKCFNPYIHLINKDYIIYIHSAIEYFIKL